MGASEDLREIIAPNRAAAEKLAAEIMEQDRFENGHEYSGTIGMASGVRTFVHPKPLTEDQARVWIFGEWDDASGQYKEGKAEKWGPAILVNVKAKNRKRRWFLGAVCSE